MDFAGLGWDTPAFAGGALMGWGMDGTLDLEYSSTHINTMC